jgi:hypothetical protein
LDHYAWAGHSVILGNQTLDGQRVEEVLSYFGKRARAARENYRRFIADGASQGERNELVGGGLQRVQKTGVDRQPVMYDERILVSGEFVQCVSQEHGLNGQTKPLPPVGGLVRQVSEALGLKIKDIRNAGRSKPVADARGLISYIGYKKMGYSGEVIARELGITRSGVCKRAVEGEDLLNKDERLKELFRF